VAAPIHPQVSDAPRKCTPTRVPLACCLEYNMHHDRYDRELVKLARHTRTGHDTSKLKVFIAYCSFPIRQAHCHGNIHGLKTTPDYPQFVRIRRSSSLHKQNDDHKAYAVGAVNTDFPCCMRFPRFRTHESRRIFPH